MKTKLIIRALFLSCFIIQFTSITKAQTSVGYTIDLYVDNNSNLIHDAGEPNLPNAYNIVNARGQATCSSTYGSGTFYSNCPGGLHGGYVASCNANNFTAEVYDVVNLIQPGIPVVNNEILGSTYSVTNIPLKPSTLNQAFVTNAYTQFKNTNAVWASLWTDGKTGGVVDTAVGTLCNNSTIDIGVFNGFTIYNVINCTNLKTNLSFKIDGTTIDTYSFVGGATNNYSVIPLSTGTVQVWYAAVLPYMSTFSYSVNNYPALSSGYHTFSIESAPVGMSYSATTVLKSVLYVDDCGQFSGNAFVDCNSDCVKNPGEYYPGYIMNLNMTSATNTITVLPDATGNFAVNAPIGTYSVNIIPYGGYASFCTSTTAVTTITTGSTYTMTIPLMEISAPATDFSSLITFSGANPGPGAVPGGTITINAYNYRTGSACAVIPNPSTLKVALPPLMSFGNVIGSTPAPSSIITAVTGDTIVWNSPAPNGLHQFTAITATNAVIGNSYCVKSIIYPLSDGNMSNNTHKRCAVYGGPFDPNAKRSEAPGMAANGDILPSTPDLVYTVEFQNLGTGMAVNVNIKDTIDVNLDLSSLLILSSSAPVQLQSNSVNNVVEFKFSKINLLPAVTNEPASHGYVQYKINLKPSLPLGTKITNRAHIYFDYNSAVATNKTINTIVLVTGVNELKLSDLITLYPNPTGGDVNIKTAVSVLKLEVINSVGQTILSKNNISSNNSVVDLSSLTQGVYFIRLQTENGIIIKKLIKE